MNHGMDRKEAEHYCNKQEEISDFMSENREELTLTHFLGLFISYGRK